MEDVSVLQAIFLRENNLRQLSSKLADPAKKNDSSEWTERSFLFAMYKQFTALRTARR